MISEKIVLTPQDIVEKEFNIVTKGFRPQEVDEFLDIIINDYAEFNKILKSLSKEVDNLTRENNELRKELRRLKDLEAIAEDDMNNRPVNNVDLLKRISQLEKIVYGKGNQE